jgi:KaiC/GvpD/RAD55 family RecA-like ATPase
MSLTFGIPSLDELLELPGSDEPKPDHRAPSNATSISILGPDGSGKSLLALHLASAYRRWCCENLSKGALPKIVYVSSDLEVHSAKKVWDTFKLGRPFERHIPFERLASEIVRRFGRKSGAATKPTQRTHAIKLQTLTPSAKPGDKSSVAGFLCHDELTSSSSTHVGFVDLARQTAGDDWNFVNSLIVSLNAAPGIVLDNQRLSHLVIIDSVAGFETFMGKLDAFGMEQTRRARIAQAIRNAGAHAHLVFVVEEPDEGKRLPEEYVTDVVVRLRMKREGSRPTRTVEIEKARARNHASGEHPFEIRNLKGSSTGEWENADAPSLDNNYVHVFHSLPHRNLRMGAKVGGGGPVKKGTVVPTGLSFLDKLLEQQEADGGDVQRGLWAGTTAALIGEPGTGKSAVGECFLAHAFADTIAHALTMFFMLSGKAKEVHRNKTLNYVHERLEQSVPGPVPAPAAPRQFDAKKKLSATLKAAWHAGDAASEAALKHPKLPWNNPATAGLPRGSVPQRRAALRARRAPLSKGRPNSRTHFLSENPFTSKRPAGETVKMLFRHPNLRTPAVLLSTTDRTTKLLTHRCLGYLADTIRRVVEDNGLQAAAHRRLVTRGLKVVHKIIEEQLIVRRIDMDNALGATLFEMMKTNCIHAQYLIYGEYFPSDQRVRNARSGRIRLVIDDLRVLSSLCPAVASDSAFLPYLVFDLEREGVTSLIIHTDSLRPGERAVDSVSANLISLMRQLVLAWSAPLEGQSRIAISAIPATSKETNGIVRELEVGRLPTPPMLQPVVETELTRVDVTRHLELYAELESGKPRLVPLAIYLLGSTSGCRQYADQEDVLFQKQFMPVSGLTRNGQAGRVLWPIDSVEHSAIRDVMHLPWDVKADHTIVDQVDGFWSLDYETGALASQRAYLTSPVRSEHEDPFNLFGGPPLWHGSVSEGPWARQKYFRNSQYESRIFAYGEKDEDDEDMAACTGEVTEPTRGPAISSKRLLNEMPDRVPFTWDFGFLLVPADTWHKASNNAIRYHANRENSHLDFERTVGGVLEQLQQPRSCRRRVSWRAFLGACKEVADQARKDRGIAPVPFDVAATSGETLLSVILEIWFSEIASVVASDATSDFARMWGMWQRRLEQQKYQPVHSSSPAAKCYSLASLLKQAFSETPVDSIENAFKKLRDDYLRRAAEYYEKKERRSKHGSKRAKLLRTWALEIAAGKADRGHPNAILVQELLHRYEEDAHVDLKPQLAEMPIAALCLYKTWLLLLDVIDFGSILDPANSFEARQPKVPSPHAMAVRHYYRTACEAQRQRGDDVLPQYALAMPGRFSVRGDSFLASAQASRSQLLAANAIDLLCSRRANLTRMQLGIGLPVRDVMRDDQCNNMRTALKTLNSLRTKLSGAPVDDGQPETRLDAIRYSELCALGGPPPGGREPGQPPRRAEERDHQTRWLFRNGMPDYDRTSRAMQKWLMRLFRWTMEFRAERILTWDGGFRAYDSLSAGRFAPIATYSSFERFASQCDYLIAELDAAERHVT